MSYTSNKKSTDLEAKVTPVDADVAILGDSADSGRAKKLTWANLKATIKAYTDTLYPTTKATAAEVATGTDDTKYTTPLAVAPYANQSLFRQAIINGNFDVWQRGTSLALVDTTVQFQSDRWYDYESKDGGTLPTLTRSRQLLISGDITNAFYYTRLTTDGAGTSLGVSSQGAMAQKIENGTRLLCGLNKQITVSFWAKSDIANKRICPVFYQSYGTGGSPSSPEYIQGTPITLTSTWTKYTATFTTNTLVGKTFGTSGDDFLQLAFYYMWGTTLGNIAVQTGVSAETFVGAGNIDIAQVQLCAGSVALPFQPKSFAEELRDCQRYYEKSYAYATALGNATETGASISLGLGGACGVGDVARLSVRYKVPKRTATTPSTYDIAGTINKGSLLLLNGTRTDDIATTVGGVTTDSFDVTMVSTSANHRGVIFHWFCNSEL